MLFECWIKGVWHIEADNEEEAIEQLAELFSDDPPIKNMMAVYIDEEDEGT